MTEFWYNKTSAGKFRLAIACNDDLSEDLGVELVEGYYRAKASRKKAKRLLKWLKKHYAPVDVHKGELPPEVNTIHQGDCLDWLQELPDNCIDLVCTDPPYGIKFLAKDWDKAIPPTEVWEECLRVLKPGAFAFVMCTPRQDCLSRMMLRLEEAGFRTNFTSVYWVYATGWNKSANLSKAADKRAGAERKVIRVEDRRSEYDGKSRKSVAVNTNWRDAEGRDDYRDVSTCVVTAPATEEAERLDGSYAGFQPKPALEPVIVAMKPLDEKTFLDQALKNRKGCVWFDNCRIPTTQPHANRDRTGEATKSKRYSEKGSTNFAAIPGPRGGDARGRFAANLLVSDDVLNDGQVRSSCRSTKKHSAYKGKSTTRMLRGDSSPDNQYDDSGSFSRYFDLDACS